MMMIEIHIVYFVIITLILHKVKTAIQINMLLSNVKDPDGYFLLRKMINFTGLHNDVLDPTETIKRMELLLSTL